jgi:two-component sensor histidine kinase
MPSVASKIPDPGRVRNSIEVGPRFEERLLLRELTHRINNELATTIGFVSVTAMRSGSDDVKLALESVVQYLHNYAGIYRALQMPAGDARVDAAEYLRELCQSIGRAKLQHRGIELAFIERPLQLSASRCWRLGMIVSELIGNASRHAFRQGGGNGKIQVQLLDHEAMVECTVSDNGSGSENGRPGQGLKIIRSLVRDLGGTINHQFGATGTSARLCFPLGDAERIDTDADRLNFRRRSEMAG